MEDPDCSVLYFELNDNTLLVLCFLKKTRQPWRKYVIMRTASELAQVAQIGVIFLDFLIFLKNFSATNLVAETENVYHKQSYFTLGRAGP